MFRKTCQQIALSVILFNMFPLQALAQVEVASEVSLLPDWSIFAFADFERIGESGEIAPEFDDIVGWKVSRNWQEGDSLQDILKLGDMENSLAPHIFSLEDIYYRVNKVQNPELELEESQLPIDLKLSDFSLIENQTLGNLSEVVPGLKDLEVREVPPFAEIAEQNGFSRSKTIGTLVEQNPDFAETTLDSLELEKYGFDSIPNLSQTQLKDLEGFEEEFISEIPGLEDLPFSDFPNPVSASASTVARIDFIWGNFETNRSNTISGSKVEGFNVPCETNCGYLELDDLESFGRNVTSEFEGSEWIQGQDHWVSGGTGCFSGGSEPTGIHPFGDSMKSVLWTTDESTASAEIVTFFNIKTMCGDSAYFIGPIPFPNGQVSENDSIYLGSGI